MQPQNVPAEPLEIAFGTLNGELHKRLLEPGLVTVEQWNEHFAPRFKAVADVILGSSVHARSYRVHESSYPPVGESPWIPVGRRLPTHPYTVFAVIVASAHFQCDEDDPMVDAATYFPDEKAWHINHGDDDVLVTVSLWMDVPLIPHRASARIAAKRQTPAEVAQLAVEVMGADNGCAFKPRREQLERLVGGIARMMVAGCKFTTAEIELWGAGEHGEMLEAFQHLDGFEPAQQAMVDIFDGLPLLSHDEAPTEIKDLFARNTGDYMPTETEKEAIDNGLAEIMRQLGRLGAPRVLFRPLLSSGLIGVGTGGTTYVIIDSEQPEAEQVIALWHETLHLLGLKDETLVEAFAQRLAQACPDILPAVKQVAGGA